MRGRPPGSVYSEGEEGASGPRGKEWLFGFTSQWLENTEPKGTRPAPRGVRQSRPIGAWLETGRKYGSEGWPKRSSLMGRTYDLSNENEERQTDLVFASTSSSPLIVSSLARKTSRTTRKSQGIVVCLQYNLYKAIGPLLGPDTDSSQQWNSNPVVSVTTPDFPVVAPSVLTLANSNPVVSATTPEFEPRCFCDNPGIRAPLFLRLGSEIKDLPHDLPKEDLPHDLPKEDLPHDLPEEDLPHDLPKEDLPNDLPEEDLPHD
eukprot:gene22890-30065_t